MTWVSPQIARLPGGRLHLQHGPIDLIIGATGAAADVASAEAAAAERFPTVLGELAAELPLLRRPLKGRRPPEAASPVARRMIAACWPHRAVYITPMAAVAGSVADKMAAVMRSAAPALRTLYVNNGGDIAVHAAPGETLRVGVVADLERALPEGLVTVTAASGIGGIATSGWRGRSFSLGVADAVTILARSAAEADAAATMVANAADVDDPAVRRAPARTLDPDSDLGERLVTTDVGALHPAAVRLALDAGAAEARRLLEAGLILGAALALQGDFRIVS
jgi:ApbE superfamily uncharacterized protein (UPF0280 family)